MYKSSNRKRALHTVHLQTEREREVIQIRHHHTGCQTGRKPGSKVGLSQASGPCRLPQVAVLQSLSSTRVNAVRLACRPQEESLTDVDAGLQRTLFRGRALSQNEQLVMKSAGKRVFVCVLAKQDWHTAQQQFL